MFWSASVNASTDKVYGAQDHDENLLARVDTLQKALTKADPPIPNFHPSTLIDRRKLHLTLGVMNLAEPRDTLPTRQEAQGGTSSHPEATKSVESAVALLVSLRPQILEVIHASSNSDPLTATDSQRKLAVSLERLDVMPPEKNNPERTHILWVGPNPRPGKNQSDRILWDVCG